MRVRCGAKAEDELSVSALLDLEEGKQQRETTILW